MKKSLLLLATSILFTQMILAQETLQSVTDRGSYTTNRIVINKNNANTSWYNASFETQGVNPGIAFHYPNIFAASLWLDNGGKLIWDGNHILAKNGIVMSRDGFQTLNYLPGRNRIWSFGDADDFGISYHQSSNSIYGGDGIGIHFGNTQNPQVNFLRSGEMLVGRITSDGNKLQVFGDNADMMSLTGAGNTPVQFNAYNTDHNGFRIVQRSNHPLSLWTNTQERVTISATGNVGIGTTSPSVKLDVIGKSRLYNRLGTNDYTFIGQHQGQFRIVNGLGPLDSRALEFALLDNGTGVIQANESGIGYNSLSLNPVQGNVGIGTTIPDEKLTVNGKIHAKEVKVDLTVPGPDYVFKEDYKLTPLAEIQSYIKTNKHLPEIPSAKEMEKNGINLSEMNMLLLKKVEELTLHLIKQNEEIQILKSLIKN